MHDSRYSTISGLHNLKPWERCAIWSSVWSSVTERRSPCCQEGDRVCHPLDLQRVVEVEVIQRLRRLVELVLLCRVSEMTTQGRAPSIDALFNKLPPNFNGHPGIPADDGPRHPTPPPPTTTTHHPPPTTTRRRPPQPTTAHPTIHCHPVPPTTHHTTHHTTHDGRK